MDLDKKIFMVDGQIHLLASYNDLVKNNEGELSDYCLFMIKKLNVGESISISDIEIKRVIR